VSEALELLITKVFDTADWLEARGVDVSAAIKRRDKAEPGRRRKEAAEERIYNILRKIWRSQEKKIREMLEGQYPQRKAILGFADVFGGDEVLKKSLYSFLFDATVDGIALFGEDSNLTLDYTLTNAEAALVAKDMASKLFEEIDATTEAATRKAISAFVETPGMTIGDVMGMLPLTEQRAEQRAQLISVTEITRAYAEGNKLAGLEMKKQFPGVRVIKIWYTNNDDLVCGICGPVHREEVELEETFENGLENPPAHPGCRCWTTTTTAIGTEKKEVSEIPMFKTKEEATQFLIDHGYGKYIDFGKLDIKTINDIARSTIYHMEKFPELKGLVEFLGSAQARNKFVKEFYRLIVEERVKQIYGNLTVDRINKIVEQQLKYYAHKIPGNIYAYSFKASGAGNVGAIVVNEKFGKDYAAFIESIEKCIAQKWHPEGTGSVKAILDHEYGHQLTDLLNINLDKEINEIVRDTYKKGAGDLLSDYARKNTKEFISEAWTEFLNNPNPRPVAVSIGNRILYLYSMKK